MKTLYNERRRREIHDRLRRLTPDKVPQWGKFDAPRMVVHCADAICMALGRLPTKSKNTPLRRAPLKQLFVYWMPWPKGVPTAPELLARTPADWSAEVERLTQLIDEAGTVPHGHDWGEHPAFGRMSHRAWGVLGYRHLDHHFRQFGI
jgi:hypothetical protein